MTNDEIKELIRLVQETGIAELEVQNGESRVRIRNGAVAPVQEITLPSVGPFPVNPAYAPPVAPPAQHSRSATHAVTPPAAPEEEINAIVKSPIVGTYYDSASPDSAPFVKVGDHVQPKQVLCIIESMKLMNEIEAEIPGIIVAKLVENGKPVEYGESLFSIRPS
jgi:acetyl-CoA carboxylase biotin carboxyl carrier protein